MKKRKRKRGWKGQKRVRLSGGTVAWHAQGHEFNPPKHEINKNSNGDRGVYSLVAMFTEHQRPLA